ncbi:MAG: type II secretion system F family protein [Patescibacteria group bacterium]|nr:type II secretion system F family protein [Patescibacteria group bacterium]
MPSYIYIAKNKKGENQTDHAIAINKHELASILRNQGLVLISAEVAGRKKEISYYLNIIKRIKELGTISLVEKMMFSRHLSVMINAGLSLNKALQILAQQTKSPKFKKIISQVEISVSQGKTFSESLKKYPKVFSELYVNMIEVGEAGGNLSEVLNILAEQMKKNHELISRVRGAMMYPAVIVIAMFGIGILMMIMVVPKLTEVFEELKVELPLSTRAIMFISSFLKDNIFLGIIIAISLFFAIKLITRNKEVRRALHGIYLHLPIFGSLIRKINSARLSRTLSSLIESGVPITKSLEVVAGTLSNIHFKETLLDATKEIQKGKKLSDSLNKYENLYTPMVIQMIGVGEETGSLSEILKNLADFYEEEIDNVTKNMSSVLEPILMVFIGVAVGFFAISMIQPMYSMMSGV